MSDPHWLTIARSYLGTREYTPQRPGPDGALSNPLIEQWQRKAGIRRPDDEVPWCAAFVTAMMVESGIDVFRTSSARAWSHFGEATAPRLGCVVALWRGDPHGPHGHVGLCVGDGAKPGTVRLLGGNQGNAVTVHDYPTVRVIGYRWPTPRMLAAAGLDADGVRISQ